MNRGDRREKIFRGKHDREMFLETLGQACEKTGWRVYAYCLMKNHFQMGAQSGRQSVVRIARKCGAGEVLRTVGARSKWLPAAFGGVGMPRGVDDPKDAESLGLLNKAKAD